jgi:hypothetical protein
VVTDPPRVRNQEDLEYHRRESFASLIGEEKMFNLWKRLFIALIVGVFVLTACNMPTNTTPEPQDDPNLIYTAAAETVSAQLTLAASGGLATPTSQSPVDTDATPSPPAQGATATQAATSVTQATATSAPTTQVPVPCDRASFIEDVTYKDGTEVAPGATFVKTWKLRNTGSCTWNSSYSVVFVRGDSLGAPASVQLTTGSVAPGQEIEVSVAMKAPDTPKEYEGRWRLRNGSNEIFGVGADGNSDFWVKVNVVSPVTPTPTATSTPVATVNYNFTDRASGAEWRNATTLLPWGDPDDDTPGLAVILENARLNDNRTYSKVLATYPQFITDGVITGKFPAYTVQSGDRFRSNLGFRSPCGSGRVKFQLSYQEGDGAVVSLREWSKSCDTSLLFVEVDLSALAGRNINFILGVHTDGSHVDDRAVWLEPQIVR